MRVDQAGLGIASTAIAGPVLPTPIIRIQPVGSFLDTPVLSFVTATVAGEKVGMSLRFTSESNLRPGANVTLSLPGFSAPTRVIEFVSSVPFSAISIGYWDEATSKLRLEVSLEIPAGEPVSVLINIQVNSQTPCPETPKPKPQTLDTLKTEPDPPCKLP